MITIDKIDENKFSPGSAAEMSEFLKPYMDNKPRD